MGVNERLLWYASQKRVLKNVLYEFMAQHETCAKCERLNFPQNLFLERFEENKGDFSVNFGIFNQIFDWNFQCD